MSLGLIEVQIRRFLASDEPEVICITGRWGVGKTFAWKKLLQQAADTAQIKLNSYSYVSLFGVNSLDQAKLSVFENQRQVSAPNELPTTEWLVEKVKAAAILYWGKKATKRVLEVPFLSRFTGSLGPLWFGAVSKTIICVDDIERRGTGLSIKDVLGLVSLLKEQKRCKVVLVLNDDALTEVDHQDFGRYFEKTVDASFRFAPTPEQSTRIALDPAVATNKQLADNCITLGISNIRVIKKIERAIARLEPLLTGFDEEVTRAAIASLTLFGWSVYEPGIAPSLEYLLKREDSLVVFDTDKRVSAEEAAWNALLDTYRFTYLDDFDKVLLEGLQKGYFDPTELTAHGEKVNARTVNAKQADDFRMAWELLHNSFADNQKETLDGIQAAFFRDSRNISPRNLNGTVILFKDLGEPEAATRMIAHYVSTHADNREILDLSLDPFGSDVHDPEVIAAFAEALASLRSERKPDEILLSVKSGWNDKDLAAVASLHEDDYYTLFKNNSGDRLYQLVSSALFFDRIVNASASQKEISNRARRALNRIGLESPINARRVRKYGISRPKAEDAEA